MSSSVEYRPPMSDGYRPPVGPAPHGRAPEQPPPPPSERSVGELVKTASEQLSELVRQEMRLAQAEMAAKGKRFTVGGAMLGGAGVFGFVALQAAAGTAIAALALVLPVWAAALIVAGLLGLVAGQLALSGRAQLRRAAPPRPERTLAEVRADIEALKESAHR